MRRQMIPVRIQVEAHKERNKDTVKLHLAFLCQKGVRMPKLLKAVAWIMSMKKEFDVRAMMVVITNGEKGRVLEINF